MTRRPLAWIASSAPLARATRDRDAGRNGADEMGRACRWKRYSEGDSHEQVRVFLPGRAHGGGRACGGGFVWDVRRKCAGSCPIPPITLFGQPQPPPPQQGPVVPSAAPTFYRAETSPALYTQAPCGQPVTLYHLPVREIQTYQVTPPSLPLCRAEAPSAPLDRGAPEARRDSLSEDHLCDRGSAADRSAGGHLCQPRPAERADRPGRASCGLSDLRGEECFDTEPRAVRADCRAPGDLWSVSVRGRETRAPRVETHTHGRARVETPRTARGWRLTSADSPVCRGRGCYPFAAPE